MLNRLFLVSIFLLIFSLSCQKPPPKTIEFWIGGDLHLAKGKDNVLLPLQPFTKEGIGIVNLEGAISTSETSWQSEKKILLFNAPDTREILRRSGIQVVGIVNNHSKDAGPNSLENTAASLSKTGLLPSGGPAGIARIDLHGWRVAISSYDLTNSLPSSLKEDLDEAKKTSDVLMVGFHVTGPPSYLPSPRLKEAVHIAVESGATVVFAHGSHSVGPVERRNGTVIAWGLGNLAFSCECTDESDAILVKLSWNGKIMTAAVIPIEAGLMGKNAYPAKNPDEIFELLEALESSPLTRKSDRAFF